MNHNITTPSNTNANANVVYVVRTNDGFDVVDATEASTVMQAMERARRDATNLAAMFEEAPAVSDFVAAFYSTEIKAPFVRRRRGPQVRQWERPPGERRRGADRPTWGSRGSFRGPR